MGKVKSILRKTEKKLSILHLILAVRETSMPYNELCLPWADRHNISVCTYFDTELSPAKTITLFEGNGTLPGFFRALSSALNAGEYDVVHVHSPHLGLLFLINTLCSYRTALSSAVLTVHDSYQNYKARNRTMFLPVFAAFRSVVFCSRSSYESFPLFYKRLAGNRSVIVTNGVNINRIDNIVANLGRSDNKTSDFTIVNIGRLVEVKNPFTVLAAFRLSIDPNSRLCIIGDGPLRHFLTMQSRQEGFENQIEFTGLIPRERVFEYLLGADLFVSTSRGEGLPIAVLEAMACRCPVLLSDIPPHREIAEGVDFIPLINPDDTAGFAREIKKFREMSVVERNMIGQNCRNLVEERFSLAVTHDGYEKVYAEIMGDSAGLLLESVR